MRHLKVFGCICYSQVPKEKRYKLDETSERCIFTGYSSQSNGYRLYNLKINKIVISRDVLFDEKATWNQEQNKGEKNIVDVEEIKTKSTLETENNEGSPQVSPPSSPSASSGSSSSFTSPKKMKSLADIYTRCNFYVLEPENFEHAIKDKAWRKAMQEAINVIEKNKTWQLVERPINKEIIGVKWVYRVKYNSDGSVRRNKARLVAKDYSQQPVLTIMKLLLQLLGLTPFELLLQWLHKEAGYYINLMSNQHS